MARLPRFAVPGQPQHVIQRGNNREVIFVSDDDYRFYLEALQEACVKYQESIGSDSIDRLVSAILTSITQSK